MYSFYQKVRLPETNQIVGTGWLPPLPDMRDYTTENPEITALAKNIGLPANAKAPTIPSKMDLRQWCSDVENQGGLGSCTANAAAAVVEYLENKAYGKHIDVSRLFIYKATRELLGVKGDTGAWLRNTMGALALCGAPPESHWPYTDRLTPDPADGHYFDREPTAFIYAIADNYEAVQYFSHDPLGENVPTHEVLASVKRWIATGTPAMFGFFGFPSFDNSDVPGGVPFPAPGEQAIWGHAVAAVGYDDSIKITNTKSNQQTTGALLIRNSWGKSWGDQGYGWIPYEYVLKQIAMDFWSMQSMKWVETKHFGLPG